MIRMSRSSIRSYFSPAKKERVGHSHSRAATSTTTSRSTSSSVSSDHYMLSTPPPPAHAPLAPSPLQQRFSSSSADSGVSYSTASTGLSGDRKRMTERVIGSRSRLTPRVKQTRTRMSMTTNHFLILKLFTQAKGGVVEEIGVQVTRGIKTRIRRMILLGRSLLDPAPCLSLWIGQNLELPSRG